MLLFCLDLREYLFLTSSIFSLFSLANLASSSLLRISDLRSSAFCCLLSEEALVRPDAYDGALLTTDFVSRLGLIGGLLLVGTGGLVCGGGCSFFGCGFCPL